MVLPDGQAVLRVDSPRRARSRCPEAEVPPRRLTSIGPNGPGFTPAAR